MFTRKREIFSPRTGQTYFTRVIPGGMLPNMLNIPAPKGGGTVLLLLPLLAVDPAAVVGAAVVVVLDELAVTVAAVEIDD